MQVWQAEEVKLRVIPAQRSEREADKTRRWRLLLPQLPTMVLNEPAKAKHFHPSRPPIPSMAYGSNTAEKLLLPNQP